jgi:hypothetical protein
MERFRGAKQVSDTPRTDEVYRGFDLVRHSFFIEFAQELERELNECKKSPWKPFAEMPDELRDGRWILFRWKSVETWTDSRYWNKATGVWASSDEVSDTDSDYAKLKAEYMEIPK